jgi:DNA-directed RNA polymerase specialized sigma24 family protein
MLVEDVSTRDSLLRMIRPTTTNLALRDDLVQEALIHLWLTEARRPGQTRSWYLQSCKFHVLHYLASGRSVDSGKRRNGQRHPEHDADGQDVFLEQVDPYDAALAWVGAREIISLLSPRLTAQERAVLLCLADGLGPREIGRRLGISHTMAIKHRRKIATLLARLDAPSPSLPANGANGTVHGANGVRRLNGNGALHPHPASGNGRNHAGHGADEIKLPASPLPANGSRYLIASAEVHRLAQAS